MYGANPVECIPNWGGPPTGTPIPVAIISHKDGKSLKKELEARPLEVQLEITTSLRKSQTANLIATLPGTKQENEILIISAHHDTVTTVGANDNASGIKWHMDRLKKNGMTEEKMLYIARDLELAVLENCYNSIVKTSNSEFQSLMGEIVSDTVTHHDQLERKIKPLTPSRS